MKLHEARWPALAALTAGWPAWAWPRAAATTPRAATSGGGGGGGDVAITMSCPRSSATRTSTPATAGGEEAADELGATVQGGRPGRRAPDAQVSYINTAAQQGRAPDRVGQRPERDLRRAQRGPRRRHQGRHLRLRHRPRVPRPVHQPGHRRGHRDGAARDDLRAGRRLRRDRDPVGDGQRHQPERLDRDDEGGARRKPEYADLKLVDTVYGDDDDQKSFDQSAGAAAVAPEPQGHHLADHRRHRRRRPLPVRLGLQGQGHADRPRHAEPDARVRQGRHRHRRSRCGTRPTSATWPRTPPPRWPPARSPARRATSSRPASSASTPSARTASVLLGDPFVFNAANIDDFNF